MMDTSNQSRLLQRVARFSVHSILMILVVLVVLPMYLVVVQSFKDRAQTFSSGIFSLPQPPTLQAWYRALFTVCTGSSCRGIFVNFMNSVCILIPSVVLQLTIALVSAYRIYFYPSKLTKFALFSMAMMSFFPIQCIVYPFVRLEAALSIFGSFWGLLLVHVFFGSPFMVVLITMLIGQVPQDLVRVAQLEGAGFYQILWYVVLPLARPIMIIAVVLATTTIWNDYVLGLTFGGKDWVPMTVALNNLTNASSGALDYPLGMAATILTAMVPMVIYIAAGKYFVRGLTSGALKG